MTPGAWSGPTFAIVPNDWKASGDAKSGVQLLEPIFQRCNILGVRGLKLTQVFLIDVCDLAGFDGRQKTYQPISLLMPIFCAHDSLKSRK